MPDDLPVDPLLQPLLDALPRVFERESYDTLRVVRRIDGHVYPEPRVEPGTLREPTAEEIEAAGRASAPDGVDPDEWADYLRWKALNEKGPTAVIQDGLTKAHERGRDAGAALAKAHEKMAAAVHSICEEPQPGCPPKCWSAKIDRDNAARKAERRQPPRSAAEVMQNFIAGSTTRPDLPPIVIPGTNPHMSGLSSMTASQLAMMMASKGLPDNMKAECHPDVLALYGLDLDLLESLLNSPQSVTVDTSKEGRRPYPVLRFRRGDACAIVGFRERYKPMVLGIYVDAALVHDDSRDVQDRTAAGPGGQLRVKPGGQPTSLRDVIKRLQGKGCEVKDPHQWPDGLLREVRYGDKMVGRLRVGAEIDELVATYNKITQTIARMKETADV